MYYKKIFAALLSISIFALVSCATSLVSTVELTQIQAEELSQIQNDVIQEGNIIKVNNQKAFSSDNHDIQYYINNRFYWPFRIVTAINNSTEQVNINCNGNESSIKLTYDYHTEKNPDADEFTRESDKYISFVNHIKIKNAPDEYSFENVGHSRPLFFFMYDGFSSNNYCANNLPAVLASFTVKEKNYKVCATKMSVYLPKNKEQPFDKEAIYSEETYSFRDFLKEKEQVFLILDDENNIFASFTQNKYLIYDTAENYSEDNSSISTTDLAFIIGLYSRIFELVK